MLFNDGLAFGVEICKSVLLPKCCLARLQLVTLGHMCIA